MLTACGVPGLDYVDLTRVAPFGVVPLAYCIVSHALKVSQHLISLLLFIYYHIHGLRRDLRGLALIGIITMTPVELMYNMALSHSILSHRSTASPAIPHLLRKVHNYIDYHSHLYTNIL